MAQNWWEDDPVAEGNNSNWWSSDPLADAPAADPARQELPAGVVPSAAGGGRGIVNPPPASEPQPQQQEQPGFFGRLADSFGTGIEQAKSALSSINVTAQNEVVKAKREQLARLEASGMADSPDAASLRTQLEAVTKRQGQYIADLAQKQQALAAAPVYQGVRDLGQAKTFGDAWSIFAKDPVNIALNLGAQSLPAMAPGIITSAINPVAGMAVMGASSAGVEFGSSIMEFAQKNGVDTSNRDALASFYSNPEMLDAAKSYAATRAGIIGLADTASAGIASKTLVPKMITGPVARVATNTVAQMGVQGVSGGVGEAGAQIATEGRITSPGEVVAEIAGEFAGAPLEVAGMRANVRKERELNRQAQPTTTVNFTPPDSVTSQAGLAPVVVPLPQGGIVQGEMDAGATGPVQRATADGPGQRGDLGTPGVEPAGVGGVDPIGDVRPGAERVDAVDGAAGAVGDARVQPAPPIAGDPLRRAADTNLLARAEAAQPAPVEQPATIWTGRKGDGYDTRGDAEIALPTRIKREPELRWEIEQMPSGKFRLAGYEQQPAAQAQPEAQPQAQAITAQQFMQNPAQAIQTAQQITFAPGQLGAVKIADRKALNGTFNVQEMDDGTTVFTRAAAPAGSPAVAGGLGQRAAQPSAEQQSAVLADLNKASAGRFAAVAANTSFTGVAQRIAAAFGRPVMLIRDRNGNAGFNALFYPRQGVIAANVDSDRPMYAVVTHEVYHGLPEDLRQRTTEAVMATVTPEQRARFLSEFAAYQKADAKAQDEELVARIIEQDAENPQFWQKLADRMGDSEFAKLAREILGMLDRLLAGFTREDSSEFTSDIERVREVVAEAYAEAQERLGQPADAMASTPRKRETIGEYQAIPYKDGSTTILGDVDEIRSKLPDDVKGRVVDGGIRFTTSDSQRVRAALEGRQVAYSRAGAVLDKLPMKDGKYLGAPPDYDTPGKIPTLRKILRNLTKEGEAGRFWYENSSKAVLRMTGGNVQEARKFVALLAIYSPQAKVDTNTTFAIRAWNQYKAGQPISVKTKVMDQKATKAMQDIDAFWSGEKTGNFFFNLLREIDPTTEGKQGATIDMWMMRAGMYPTDAPTKTQYAFMENETNRIAAEMGWEPQQVQAAIWVAMKARMENSGVKKRTEASSEKKGWIRFDRDAKGKKVRVILDAQKHRDNWLAHAMRHVPSTTDTKTAKLDFEDGLFRHIGQISFEARPGRTSGSLPGIHSAPYAQQVEFQQAVQKTFYDERGTDMLASYLGLMIDNDILAPGVWQGEVSPSTQLSTVMAPVGGKDGKNKVDPAQAKLLNVYASVLGLLTRQEGVGWHRPFYATTKRDANGLDIDIGRPVNPQEAADLERAVGAWMDRNGKPEWQNSFAFISSPKGIRLVNFGITNEILQTEIVKAAESVLPDGSVRVFASDGDMPTNNWKENPNGETYVQGIRAAGRPDVLDWARDNLAPRIDAVFRDFSERYNWGDPGDVRFSAQRVGAVRQGAGRAAPGPLEAPERAIQEAALTPLPGAPKVPGFHGPDPRLVAVAEKYAADNGIELRRQAEYVQVDPERAARIAEAYEAMPHAPQDPQVREAYENLIRQTRAQYDALVDAGYQFWFMDMSQPASQEYASTPWNAMRDIRANQQMGVFPTEDGFGTNEDFTPESNPLLADTGLEWPSGSLTGPRKRVLANDLFRAVHDAFGHGLEGSGFRAQGEENAWQAHVRLFTGSAVGAITSETRGQNSWLNYGPYGEANRTAQVEDTVFADQKTGLMPEWTWTEGRAGDMPLASANRTAGRLDGIEAYHYSKAGRQSLSSSSFGTGLQGSARDEYLNATDQRRRQRISFYVNKGTGIRPEAGVGGMAHRAMLNNIYDSNSDPQNLRKGGQAAFESAVLDAGFDGYLDRMDGDQPGQVILLGRRTVNVTPIGPRTRIDDAKPVPAATARKATREERGELVRRPDGQQMMGVINATKALRDAAPSFKLQYGEARVKVDEAAAANEALRQAGASFQFEIGDTPLASANRTVTETPEFKRWFGDSKVVDADGKPLVVYHGTGKDFGGVFNTQGGTGKTFDTGAFFTASTDVADSYTNGSAPNVAPVYLNLTNPLVVEVDGANWDRIPQKSKVLLPAIGKGKEKRSNVRNLFKGEWDYPDDTAATDDIARWARKQGYDGVIFRGVVDRGPSGAFDAESARKPADMFVAFRPEQIKSAIGNNGQFDPENADIRMSASRGTLGLFSALERNITDVPTKSASAGGWKTQIQGMINKGAIKADEVEWSGINDWLDLQTGKVTKDSVLEYLHGNGVQVQEVTLGEPSEADIEMLLDDEAGEGMTREDAIETLQGAEGATPPKYGQYTLPGGENYREVLLTLPDGGGETAQDQKQRLKEKYGVDSWFDLTDAQKEDLRISDEKANRPRAKYKSSHWDHPNILAHIRVNDRTDADGKRVLFVEEIQSDFGQDFKKARDAIRAAVDSDFQGIVDRMKKAGLLEVECD